MGGSWEVMEMTYGWQLGSDGDDLWVGSWEVMEMTYGWAAGK